MGYNPHWDIEEELRNLIKAIAPYKDDIRQEVIMPKIKWR